ncbi:MAG: hypothetical protein ACKO9F_05480, partial [Caldilinea sp.]
IRERAISSDGECPCRRSDWWSDSTAKLADKLAASASMEMDFALEAKAPHLCGPEQRHSQDGSRRPHILRQK